MVEVVIEMVHKVNNKEKLKSLKNKQRGNQKNKQNRLKNNPKNSQKRKVN